MQNFERAWLRRLRIADASFPRHPSSLPPCAQNAVNPLFNLTMTHSDALLAHFYGQNPPSRYNQPQRAAKKQP